MKILIVYEEVPESTNLYIVDATPAEAKKIRKCAGKRVNSTNEVPECLWLSDWIDGREKHGIDEPLDIHGVDCVIVTGFIL